MHRIEAYFTLAVIVFAAMSILYLPILFFQKKRGRGVLRQCSYIALFWSGFLIVFATIFFTWPITFSPEQYLLNLIPFQWLQEVNVRREFVEFVIPNIMMFIPFGYFMPVVFQSMRKLYKTTCVAFILSLCVEFVQYFIGRSSNVDDLITNSLGGIIGYGIFRISHKIFQNKTCWNKLIGN
ncbi:MAG: VanZ family protein [Oscillospiraceae bacterium]|nr:VanZ family protein [Oscillospiraceae bacterium]